MSGAVSKVAKIAIDPFGIAEDALGADIVDPLGLYHDPVEPETIEDNSLTDSEKAILADEEAKRQSKKKKETTQTVLTSPLGATTTASTAVTKLGGV